MLIIRIKERKKLEHDTHTHTQIICKTTGKLGDVWWQTIQAIYSMSSGLYLYLQTETDEYY